MLSQPAHTLAHPQLNPNLHILNPHPLLTISMVESASLYNVHSSKSRVISRLVYLCAAVLAEADGERHTTRVLHGESLQLIFAREKGEVCRWHDEVGGEGTARNFAAGDAVADCLGIS